MKPRTMTAELEQEIREDIDCNPEYRDLLLRELDAERAVSAELLAACHGMLSAVAPYAHADGATFKKAVDDMRAAVIRAKGRDA